jgi:uncharacterized membrane protein
MTPFLLRFSTSLLVATGICSYGLRKRSLSPSGAAAAFHMGVLHMTCGWTFGLVLICFFATSSKVRHVHALHRPACVRSQPASQPASSFTRPASSAACPALPRS